jgi:hypothetical protein
MLPEAAAEQYTAQQSIAGVTVASINRLWSRMGEDFDTSWAGIRGQVISVAETGRVATVNTALPYTAAVLAETGMDAPAEGRLDGRRFLSSAPDGRTVSGLFDQAPIKAKLAVAGGASTATALSSAGSWLSTTALTLMADTRREVYAADIIQRPAVSGYVRMLNPPSCSRCIILAGKWFQWNTGFRRHPRCDCLHIPAAENASGDMRTDPYATFKSMSAEQQDRVFGRINAKAIRDGADIYRVVNIEQRGLATAKAAKKYGTPSRLTVDDIYRRAGTRTNAIRMMREEGYILDRGQVVAPLSPGVRTREQILAAGRGRGVVTIEGRRVTTARAARFDAAQSGVRDPLNRSTMTAAERRLYDANYRLDYALRTGRIPQSIGANSARRGTVERVATPEDIAKYRREVALQLSEARDPKSPESLRRVARALGLIS